MKNVLKCHALLLDFYFRGGFSLLREIARAFDDYDARRHGYRLRKDILDGYNTRYRELQRTLRALNPPSRRFVLTSLFPTVGVRVVSIATAAFYSTPIALGVSLVQLVVAPYSIFAGIAAFGFFTPLFAVHYLQFACLQALTFFLFEWSPTLDHYGHFTVDWWFVLMVIAVDQMISILFCYFWTPLGRSVRYPAKRVVQSVWYGFLNCKTYWILLLVCLQGYEIDLVAIAIFALLPAKVRSLPAKWLLGPLIPLGLHWTWQPAMFYHYHRMVHLAPVYDQAHRAHHFLHDSTPFDANLYGAGLPEEWLKLLAEILLALVVGLVPYSFSPSTLRMSIMNRLGHTRIGGKHPPGGNFHVDHHAHYQRNFGSAFPPVDLLLGTAHNDVLWIGATEYTGTATIGRDHLILSLKRATSR